MLNGAWLKELCGGADQDVRQNYGHLKRFTTTFHAVISCNARLDANGRFEPLPIDPWAGTLDKREGFVFPFRFVPAGDPEIDNKTVFPQIDGLREQVAGEYFVPLLRMLSEAYKACEQGFDRTESEFRMRYLEPEGARSPSFFVDRYDFIGADEDNQKLSKRSMEDVYNELKEHYRIEQDIEKQLFYQPLMGKPFKALMKEKIQAYRNANNITDDTKGPRVISHGGKEKFVGVILKTPQP